MPNRASSQRRSANIDGVRWHLFGLAWLWCAAIAWPQGIPGTRAHEEGRAGWSAIREGRADDAARHFAAALDAEPRDPSLHLGAGVAAHLLGRPAAAQHALERALELAPGYTAAALLLGEVLYRANGALERPEELERVLSHELTHALVRAIAPRHVPTWLNEGLAVLFEPEGRHRAERELAGAADRLSADVLSGSFAGLSSGRARLAYAQSAVAVHKLIELAGASQVVALLEDLTRGEPLQAAFERRVLMPFEAFLSGLR